MEEFWRELGSNPKKEDFIKALAQLKLPILMRLVMMRTNYFSNKN